MGRKGQDARRQEGDSFCIESFLPTFTWIFGDKRCEEGKESLGYCISVWAPFSGFLSGYG